MKALMVASVGGFIDFEKNDIKLLTELGYEVTVACNTEGWEQYLEGINVTIVNVPFERNPYSIANCKAYSFLKEYINKESFDIIHCHTPVAGIITRLAAKAARKKGCRVIYTAHGFHFYKGAPRINWIIYYTAEKITSKYTDVLITINKEDYKLAKSKFKIKTIEYIPGVGIDVEKIRSVIPTISKKDLGISESDKMILSVGELNDNKNHEAVIRALKIIDRSDIHYFIAGVGDNGNHLIDVAKEFGLESNFHLLGYRKDVLELNKITDVFCLPSHREGLSVALMEAIACNTKVACSDIRGNRDLAEDCKNVVLFNENASEEIASNISGLLEQSFEADNGIEKYSIKKVQEKMKGIYVNK